MNKKVLLVGHCGPDSSYLRMAVKKADANVQIIMADDDRELAEAMGGGQIDLILLNRELGYGFDPPQGVDMIHKINRLRPGTKTMLVSNFPEAQQSAEQAGALPGFGKREIGSARATELLRLALA